MTETSTRRDVLRGVGVAVTGVAVAGCSTGGGSGDGSGGSDGGGEQSGAWFPSPDALGTSGPYRSQYGDVAALRSAASSVDATSVVEGRMGASAATRLVSDPSSIEAVGRAAASSGTDQFLAVAGTFAASDVRTSFESVETQGTTTVGSYTVHRLGNENVLGVRDGVAIAASDADTVRTVADVRAGEADSYADAVPMYAETAAPLADAHLQTLRPVRSNATATFEGLRFRGRGMTVADGELRVVAALCFEDDASVPESEIRNRVSSSTEGSESSTLESVTVEGRVAVVTVTQPLSRLSG
ncbi:hypothetical protein EFA46_006375 [Halarchaeum sp. CBA1220]|uniref:hypothetical protein n=1 Tax=Halarchaeum sp. CBA1220 TaxID=1853682 RepID=UPI000F3A8105|nr:hypothetical protein [Halarchaeum sp. CBA1220]QLC32654.1 hypothetical protein EFA46_006375 [Halarchaeum sp. CBA1220]